VTRQLQLDHAHQQILQKTSFSNMYYTGESNFKRPLANPIVGLSLVVLGALGVLSPWYSYVGGLGATSNGWQMYEALESYYATDNDAVHEFSKGPFITVALSLGILALGGYIARNQWQGNPSKRKLVAYLAMILGGLLLWTGASTNRAIREICILEYVPECNQGVGLWTANVVSAAVFFIGPIILRNEDLTNGI